MSAGKIATLTFAIAIFCCAVGGLPSLAGAALAAPDTPLVAGGTSHVVVIEYEAWFGPNAVTFQSSSARPLLQSSDMQSIGGGYDSADPAVIQQHVAWMEYMGVDAATIDLTNNVSCIFDSEWFIKKYLPGCTPAFRAENQNIRNNTGNLYPAWSGLGTSLKLIPLLGGIDQNVLFKDIDGKTAFEKEIDYFGVRMSQYPGLSVIYQGKPLMLIYLGAAQDPNRLDDPLWFQFRNFLKNHPEIERKYTFKMIAGYLDSQPDLWAVQGTPDGPVEISPQYGFWSVVDRLNPTCTLPLCPYYPTYNNVLTSSAFRVENFTASIATAGQYGWGCPQGEFPPYCPDVSLRFGEDGTEEDRMREDRASDADSYVTLDAFMNYAGQLGPIFLIIDQFNEYVRPDEGWSADTHDDIEPADLWGFGALHAVRQQIKQYRKQTGD